MLKSENLWTSLVTAASCNENMRTRLTRNAQKDGKMKVINESIYFILSRDIELVYLNLKSHMS